MTNKEPCQNENCMQKGDMEEFLAHMNAMRAKGEKFDSTDVIRWWRDHRYGPKDKTFNNHP